MRPLQIVTIILLACFLSMLGVFQTTSAQDVETLEYSPYPYIIEGEREIPIVAEADVVVVGGTIRSVAAAIAAAEEGASVFLVASRTYLGEELAGRLRLHSMPNDVGPLADTIFNQSTETIEETGIVQTTTPLRIKTVLESALLEAGVDFILASYPTDVLLTPEGRPGALIISNRSGRQAVLAKTVIDGTIEITCAELAGVERIILENSDQRSYRYVLGGSSGKNDSLPLPLTSDSDQPPILRTFSSGVHVNQEDVPLYCYGVALDLHDGSYPAIADAEQCVRDLTYRPGQLRAAERFHYTPTHMLVLEDAPVLDLSQPGGARVQYKVPESFSPKGLSGFYYVGSLTSLGTLGHGEQNSTMVGVHAAVEASKTPQINPASLLLPELASEVTEEMPIGRSAFPGKTVDGDLEIREVLTGLRPTSPPDEYLTLGERKTPVWADVDVLVIGGGTSGACAAIAAARQGADVLVVEFQEGLGGVGTVGMIGKAYHGRNDGFTREVPFPDATHNNEYKMEWFRRQIRDAGGRVWFGAIGCGAIVEKSDDPNKPVRVCGAILGTELGRGAVLADVVIDSTGAGDIAIAAGATAMYGADEHDLALQGTGLPTRPLNKTYVNTDYLLVDESDARDVVRALVGSRLTVDASAFDMGPFIQTRERRRVLGDHTLSYLDQIAGRTYPDSIVLSGSDYDSHGYPSEPYFALIPHTERTLRANHPAPGGTCYTPYRCLLPQGLEGILVTGLAVSMQRDASAMIRMQKDMHNQGYAAGYAATMAVQAGCMPREIDVRQLQQHLIEIGNLPESVLTDIDSFPLPEDIVAQAVRDFTDESLSLDERRIALAVVMSHKETALLHVRAAYAREKGSGTNGTADR